MKRLPLIQKARSSDGPVFYKTAADRDDTDEARAEKAREFSQDRPFEPPPGVDRRSFMALMGASMALAAGTGCRRPAEKIVPFGQQPEYLVPGRPLYFATSVPFYGTSVGLLVESNDGRPTKIEGNPLHPESLGATTAFIQGLILELYDPDRSTAPQQSGKDVVAAEAWKQIGDLGKSLRAAGGKGIAILTTDHRSETTRAAIDAVVRDFPETKVYRYEPFGRANVHAGLKIAFGEAHEATYDLANAEVWAAFDADLMGTEGSPIKAAKGYARRRRVEDGPLSRIYVAEPCPTVTGNAADHRLRVQARHVPDLLRGLAAALGQKGVTVSGLPATTGQLPDREVKWLDALATDLVRAKERGFVVVGNRQAPAVHALAAAINLALENVGKTVHYKPAFDVRAEGPEGLVELKKALDANQVEALLILGGNPAFNAPGDLDFAASIKKAKTSLHLSLHRDETSEVCTWHIPRAHELESWGDTRAEDGTASIIQPLIAPIYGGKTDAEVLSQLVGGTMSLYDLVRHSAAAVLMGAPPAEAEGEAKAPPRPAAVFDTDFRKAVHDGVIVGSAYADANVVLDGAAVSQAVSALRALEGPFDIAFAPDPHALDGRFANNGWLQELPDPIHKNTWTNVVAISQTTATKLGVVDGDMVAVEVGGARVELPVIATFGHADDSATVYVGQGRRFAGRVCKGAGVDVAPIRKAGAFDLAGGQLTVAGKPSKLAITQGHFMMEGRPLVRQQTVAEYRSDPTYAKTLVEHPPLDNLWPSYEYNGHKWGMTVDLSLCIGCGACVTACQAENNTPVIGAAGIAHSREMHWLRIDRYFEGHDGKVDASEDDARAVSMPMTCQHCENAPCEQVCPVAATTHSPEGINEMTYNRCIGTKYCGNNCPFKVRRFNFFNYTKDTPETTKLAYNPDVTVRSRGVMEKCSFCVQRVQEAKIAAKKENRDRLRDGEVVTACMQACACDAIIFGDLNDPASRVARMASSPRSYKMLEEINVRPRISYLGRIRNPNTTLEPPKPAADAHGAAPHGSAPHGSAQPAKPAHGEETR